MTHAVYLGLIKGHVTLTDGREIEVNGDHIFVDSQADALEVGHLVGERYAAEGHPAHDPDIPFVHTPLEEFADYVPHEGNRTIHASPRAFHKRDRSAEVPPAPPVEFHAETEPSEIQES